MRSSGSDDFWRMYHELPTSVRVQARHAYHLFADNPDHPSLRFKKLNGPGNYWSVRFGGGYRAVCLRESDVVIWLWVGTRQEFGKQF
jgi:hypothetical protein